MTRKKIRNILIIIFIIVIVTGIFLFIYMKNRDTEQKQAEPEMSEPQIVTVEDNDAVSELYRALELALSDMEGNTEDIIAGLSKSAELGNSDAMYFLGELYFQGIGVEADMAKAASYFRQSCECGNRKAMSIYGKMLFMGDGTEQNYDESASYFYTLSGEDGEASYILGVMSNLGMGVPRSAAQAGKYIDQSAESGYEGADTYRSRIMDIGGSMDDAINFELKAKKVQNLDYGTEYKDLSAWIDQYQEVVKSTENYSAFENEMTGLLDVDVNSIALITLFGNNGYLFHQNENDGTSMHDYIGDNHFSSKELEEIAANLGKEKKWVEQNGSQFVLLLIPNKETMYPEFMPSYISRSDTVTREDMLVDYLRENTDIKVIYVKDTLTENKESYPLYYKTDTHANMVGSLFMVSDLFKACYNADIEIDLDRFDIHLQDYMGDLGAMAKCTDRYANDKVYFYPESAVGEEEQIDSSMMLVGDSFSEFVNIEAGYYLKNGVDHRMITEYDYDYHKATQAGFDSANQSAKPDYVVWECVERYLDRFVPAGEGNR